MSSDDQRHVTAFLEMMAAERGAAANTLDAYRRDLADYLAFLGQSGIGVTSAKKADVSRYLSELSVAGLKPASRGRRLSAVRQLYRFLEAESVVSESPADGIAGPGKGRPLPKTLSVDEVDRLIETAARATDGLSGRDLVRAVRHHCLLEMLYATGLRVSELVSLPRSVLKGDPRLLTIRGKGGRERLVPLNSEARTALDRYLALGSQPEDGVAPVVATRSSFRPAPKKAISRGKGLRRISRRPQSRPGSTPTASRRHVLRHAFASHLLGPRRGPSERCRACSAMPTSRPPRFTPMCWKSASNGS